MISLFVMEHRFSYKEIRHLRMKLVLGQFRQAVESVLVTYMILLLLLQDYRQIQFILLPGLFQTAAGDRQILLMLRQIIYKAILQMLDRINVFQQEPQQ